jgi:hypothetical protein
VIELGVKTAKVMALNAVEQSRFLKRKRSSEDQVVYVCIDKVASQCLNFT